MRRREFITLIGGAAAAWPIATRAQQHSIPVVGFLGALSASSWETRVEALRAGLRDLGYVEGKNIKSLSSVGPREIMIGLVDLAGELIRLKVDVLVTHGTPGVLAAKQATSTIPIVMAVVGDALGSRCRV